MTHSAAAHNEARISGIRAADPLPLQVSSHSVSNVEKQTIYGGKKSLEYVENFRPTLQLPPGVD